MSRKIRTRFAALCVAFFVILSPLPARGEIPWETIYVTGASHIDLAWKWTYERAMYVCKFTYGAVLNMMDDYDALEDEENPVYYAQSNVLSYQWMEDFFPNHFARIEQRIQEGRWEIVGGMWVESDGMLPSGESFCRQFLHGQWYFQDKFGKMATVGWLPDTFGHNANMPQFMAKSGIDYFFFSKLNGNDTHPLENKLFHWRAQDGSEVLAHLAYGGYDNEARTAEIDGVVASKRLREPDQSVIFFPMGVGNHGGGIMEFNMTRMLGFRDAGYNVRFGRADGFFEGIDPETVEAVVEGEELYYERHRGTYTSRAKLKKDMRELEYKLQNAEIFASFAMLLGGEFPTEMLDDAWKRLLRDQSHDTMAGTCIDRVYRSEVAENLDIVREAGDATLSKSLAFITERIDTSSHEEGKIVAVYNPNGFTTTQPVKVRDASSAKAVFDAAGERIPSQYSEFDEALIFVAEDIPPWGWKTYSLREGEYEGAAAYAVTSTHLENDFLSVELDADAYMVGLVNKALDFEFIEPGQRGNLLQIYPDDVEVWDSWDIAFDKYVDTPYTIDGATSIAVVEDGPVRQVIEIHREGEKETYIQRIILYSGADHLDFETHVFDWGYPAHRFLKVAFPTPLVNEEKKIRHNIPYGHNIRILDGRRTDWEFVGHKWIDLTETYNGEGAPRAGITLFSVEKYGYDVANDGPGEGLSDGRCNVLRLSLLKSATSPMNSFPQRWGIVTDRGDFIIHYRLYPHAPDVKAAEIYKRGESYVNPFLHAFTTVHNGGLPPEGNFFSIESQGGEVLPTTLKVPHRNGKERELVLRLVEIAGEDSTVSLESAAWQPVSAHMADILEREQGEELVDEGLLEMEIGHFAIDTVRILFDEWSPEYDDDPGDDADDDTAPADDNDDDDDDDDGACCG